MINNWCVCVGGGRGSLCGKITILIIILNNYKSLLEYYGFLVTIPGKIIYWSKIPEIKNISILIYFIINVKNIYKPPEYAFWTCWTIFSIIEKTYILKLFGDIQYGVSLCKCHNLKIKYEIDKNESKSTILGVKEIHFKGIHNDFDIENGVFSPPPPHIPHLYYSNTLTIVGCL